MIRQLRNIGLCLTILLSAVISLASCSDKGKFTPTSSGRPYEVLVVSDQDIRSSEAGTALAKVLETDVAGLPQVEPSFKMMYATRNHFDATLKLVHNIIMVKIDPRYATPSMTYAKDPYASPQIVLTIQAPDESTFAAYVTRKEEAISNFFNRFEMHRAISILEERHCEDVAQKIQSMFGCTVFVPSEVHSIKTGSNFLWASSNTAVADQNFVIYSYPYSGKDSISIENFVAKRDSVMRLNIPGSTKGSYMTTETKGLLSRNTIDNPVLIVRGMWKMKGDQMGGPFVSHVYIDKSRHLAFTLEIFVYSPDKLKANLVRSLEASLYTMKLPGEKQKDNTKDNH
jgi:hypothetical protein